MTALVLIIAFLWFWSIFGAVIVGTTIGVASAFLPQRVPEGQGILEVGY